MSFLASPWLRAALAAAGFWSAIFGLPIGAAIAMLLLALRWRAYEAIALGLFMDMLWLPGGGFLHPLPLFTLGGVALVWALEPLRAEFLFS